MKILKFSYAIFFGVAFIIAGCLTPYEPSVITVDYQYLVIDAFLNYSDGSATVQLSRTSPLYSKENPAAETRATVSIEDDHGSSYEIKEQSNGLYVQSNIPTDLSKKYRIHIVTRNSEEYFSDYTIVKNTPDIDSVYWVPESDGIQIYVDAHDVTNQTRYYKWDFIETFEYASAFGSDLKISNGQILPRYADESLNICWRTNPAIGILLGSSARLQQDVINHFPVTFVPRGTYKLSRRYSIHLKQYAITEQAYNYWLQLKETTENLGGLFDPLPSQIQGNIYNARDPQQIAIGFFSAGSVKDKRIFVSFSELPRHLQRYPSTECVVDTIPASKIHEYGSGTLLISSFGSPFPVGYLTSGSDCIDCRTRGGVLVKPSFWN